MKTKLEDHIHQYWKLLEKSQGFSITFLEYLAQSFLQTQKNILTGTSRFFDQSSVKFGLKKKTKNFYDPTLLLNFILSQPNLG